tara:strand:- start:798 stop:1046 length:249 start_codon:yes stop_codon:yes gene_type:complete
MEDKRKNNGGHKTAGRKSKSEEMQLIELLNTHIDKDSVILKLKEFIEADNLKALEIYMAYMYGKPKETKDVTVIQEQPLFNL